MTVSVDELPAASRTVSVKVMSSGVAGGGAVNDGVAVAAPTSVIAAPALWVHAKLTIGPVEARPLSDSASPAATDWSGPALATTGGVSRATSIVAVPPPAEVTVTEDGGGTPGGKPTPALASPLPSAVRTRGRKP